jgi:hypothetical protein
MLKNPMIYGIKYGAALEDKNLLERRKDYMNQK